MKKHNYEQQVADVLKALAAPFRIKLLYALGEGEACVCHLESVLKKRQAYISQHLMVLRDVGILETRREGKYIFYRISSKELFQLLASSARMGGVEHKNLPTISSEDIKSNCVCPKCNVGSEN